MLISIITTSFSFLILISQYNFVVSVIIKINNGQINGGRNLTVGQGKEYFYFRGIPYAEPPIGNLRFEVPVPKANWSGVLDTLQDKDPCLQGVDPVLGSEDCLYVNVYTPKNPTKPCDLLPTLVWVIGGGFIVGNSTYETYGPDYLLENDIVVVTFNYRLGVFGFSSTQDLVNPGNVGLKDQLLVLQWVRDNIAHFCGDPNQVTLGGASAGSASVSYHLNAPKSQGLFQRVLMSSGTSLNQWASNWKIKDLTKKVGDKLKVDTSTSQSLINGLKGVDAIALQEAARSVSNQYGLNEGLNFGPTSEVVNNNLFWSGNPYEYVSSGNISRVPILMGYNSLETYLDLKLATRLFLTSFDANIVSILPRDLRTKFLRQLDTALKVKTKYFGLISLISLSNYKALKFLTDHIFVRGIVKFGNLAKLYNPVYFYEFDYVGGLAGFYDRPYHGVRHSEEICYYWRCYDAPANDHDYVVRDRFVQLISNFIIGGNPTPNQDSRLQNVTWSTFDHNQSYLYIGEDLVVKQQPNKEYTEFWDNFYDMYGEKPFITF